MTLYSSKKRTSLYTIDEALGVVGTILKCSHGCWSSGIVVVTLVLLVVVVSGDVALICSGGMPPLQKYNILHNIQQLISMPSCWWM